MYIILVFFTLQQLYVSQFNMTPFTRLPSLSFPEQLAYSAIRKNATEAYVSIRQGTTTKIVKWNTANASDVVGVGQYISPINPAQAYPYLHFFKGYIMAGVKSYKSQVFNQTTFEYIGEVNLDLTFGRGDFLQSKNVFLFGTITGNIGYFTLDTFPNISPVYLFNSTSFVFIQTSLDKRFVASSFEELDFVLIYSTDNWALVKNITVSSAGVCTQAWSGDSRYLMVFLYNEIYVLVYDRDNNWSLVRNQTIGHKNIRTCFYYEETNIVVAMSEFSSAVILINWYDFSVSLNYNINGWKMYRSDTKESMTIFQPSLNTTWFFNVNPFCPSNKFYSIPLKNCVQCDDFCSICNSTTTCEQCITNYALVNGQCQLCSVGTVYNATTYLCDSCSSNCLTCTSTITCTSCIAGGTLVNASCVLCALGYVYNFILSTCQVNCTQNCVICATNYSCSTCSTGYNLMSNGICEICPSNKFYSIPLKNCVQCDDFCSICNSTTTCKQCITNYTLVNGQCQLCSVGTVYNATTYLCDSCSSNCLTCTSTITCTSCIAGGTLVNASCVLCALGYVYNFILSTCQVNCTQNCVICASNSRCSTCDIDYNLMSNGSCKICPSQTFYNSINESCQSCSQNCVQCASESSCNLCVSGTQLSDGFCMQILDPNIAQNSSNIFQNNNQKDENNNTDQLEEDQAFMFDFAMDLTIGSDLFSLLNKIPGSRRCIRQASTIFMNIDHLWLYIYHKRQYGYYIDKLLTKIQNLQQEKWNLVSENFLNRTINLDMDSIAKHMDFKKNRTSWKYVEIQNQSSSFLENSIDYFFLNVPMVLCLFFLAKMLFNLFFKYQISTIFRSYAFNGYLLLMLLEGNSQSFTYLFMYDCSQLYQLSLWHKIFNAFTVFLYSIFVAQLISIFFMIKASYKKNAKYFYDNCSNTLQGSTNLLIQNGLLNFGLGSVHLMAEDFYVTQLLILLSIEASFIACITLSISKSKVYKFKYLEWQNLFGSFLRILLILTYYIDRNSPGFYDPIQQAQMHLISIYLLNWIFSTLISIFLTIKNFGQFVIKNLFQKKVISTLYRNPYLSRFYNLARRQKKKVNIKIQIINDALQFGQKRNNMEIEILGEDKNNISEISIINKVKLSKNKNVSFAKKQDLKGFKKQRNPFNSQHRPGRKRKIKCARQNIFDGIIFVHN